MAQPPRAKTDSARVLFILASIPFCLAAVLLLFLDKAFKSGGSSGGSMVFVLCGGIYIFGSIHALRGQLPLRILSSRD